MSVKTICAAALLAGFVVGCGSSEVAKNSGGDESLTLTLPRSVTLQNYSRVSAVLESAEPLNEPHFSANLFVVSVEALNGRPAVVEAGQRVVVRPLYDMDAAGGVDLSLPKNKALHSILSLTPGASFTGTVGVTNKAGWYLLNVVTQ